MLEILKFLYEVATKDGLGFIFALALLALLVFSWPTILKVIKKALEKVGRTIGEENEVDVDQESLYTHPFFREVNRKLNWEVPHFRIEDSLRSALCKDFLMIKLSAIAAKCKSFIAAGDMNKLTEEDFMRRLDLLVLDIIKEYEDKARQEKIPDIFISRFNDWHSGRIEVIYKFLQDITEPSANDFYQTNTTKFYSFLNLMTVIMDLTLLDAGKTIIHLNGELSKETYKGITSEKKSGFDTGEHHTVLLKGCHETNSCRKS